MRPMYFPEPDRGVVTEFFTTKEYPARIVAEFRGVDGRDYRDWEVDMDGKKVMMRGIVPNYALVTIG